MGKFRMSASMSSKGGGFVLAPGAAESAEVSVEIPIPEDWEVSAVSETATVFAASMVEVLQAWMPTVTAEQIEADIDAEEDDE